MAKHPDTGVRSRKRAVRIATPIAAAAAVVVIVPVAWGAIGDSGSEDGGTEKSAQSTAAGTAPEADFDNDGKADLASIDETDNHLAVSYGAKGDDGRKQLVKSDVTGVDKKGKSAFFTEYSAARDFDGDGYTDVALAVETYDSPKPGSQKTPRSGVVIVWGSEDGLEDGKDAGTYLKDVPADVALDHGTGDTLAAGDFDGDEQADLVVNVGGEEGLLKGPFTREGESAGTAEVPMPDVPGGDNGPELAGLIAADMDGDGADDLLTSHGWSEDDAEGDETGSFIAGGEDGFAKPEEEAIPGIGEATVGDVDKDGYQDLIMTRHEKGMLPSDGSLGENKVEVIYGSKDGPEPEEDRHTEIDQDTEGVPGKAKEDNSFGSSLDAGDVDGDGYADIAVGVPGEAREGKQQPGQDDDLQKEAGSVILLKGGPDGLTGEGAQRVDQSTGGESDDPETKDRYGDNVRLLDTDGSDKRDLAAHASGEDEEAGEIRVLPGTSEGLTGKGGYALTESDFGNPEGTAFMSGFVY